MWTLKVSEDQIECLLVSTKEEGYDSPAEIEMLADAMGIQVPLDLKLVDKIISDKNSDPEKEYVVARGIAPKHGRDGEIKFKVDVSAETKYLPVVVDGKIDYKNSMKRLPVHPGDLIAVIFHHTMGVAGKDIFGLDIEAKNGKPLDMTIGKGMEQESNLLFAKNGGVPKFENGQLSVEESLVIDTDVDLKTGNIDSQYSVVIYGDVCEGYEVVSGGDVKIYGAFHGTKLVAKGAITIYGGVFGHPLAKVVAKTNIQAHTLQHADVEVNNELHVSKDILHSSVNCLGQVYAGEGIVGGRVTTLKNIQSNTLGSELSKKTEVRIGFNFREEKLSELQDQILKKINEVYLKYKPSLDSNRLDKKLKGDLNGDIEQLEKNIKVCEKISENIEKCKVSTSPTDKIFIKVFKKILGNVDVRAPHCFERIVEEMDGPKSIVFDANNRALTGI